MFKILILTLLISATNGMDMVKNLYKKGKKLLGLSASVALYAPQKITESIIKQGIARFKKLFDPMKSKFVNDVWPVLEEVLKKNEIVKLFEEGGEKVEEIKQVVNLLAQQYPTIVYYAVKLFKDNKEKIKKKIWGQQKDIEVKRQFARYDANTEKFTYFSAEKDTEQYPIKGKTTDNNIDFVSFEKTPAFDVTGLKKINEDCHFVDATEVKLNFIYCHKKKMEDLGKKMEDLGKVLAFLYRKGVKKMNFNINSNQFADWDTQAQKNNLLKDAFWMSLGESNVISEKEIDELKDQGLQGVFDEFIANKDEKDGKKGEQNEEEQREGKQRMDEMITLIEKVVEDINPNTPNLQKDIDQSNDWYCVPKSNEIEALLTNEKLLYTGLLLRGQVPNSKIEFDIKNYLVTRNNKDKNYLCTENRFGFFHMQYICEHEENQEQQQEEGDSQKKEQKKKKKKKKKKKDKEEEEQEGGQEQEEDKEQEGDSQKKEEDKEQEGDSQNKEDEKKTKTGIPIFIVPNGKVPRIEGRYVDTQELNLNEDIHDQLTDGQKPADIDWYGTFKEVETLKGIAQNEYRFQTNGEFVTEEEGKSQENKRAQNVEKAQHKQPNKQDLKQKRFIKVLMTENEHEDFKKKPSEIFTLMWPFETRKESQEDDEEEQLYIINVMKKAHELGLVCDVRQGFYAIQKDFCCTGYPETLKKFMQMLAGVDVYAKKKNILSALYRINLQAPVLPYGKS